MYWITLAYVAANMFAAGYFCADQYKWYDTTQERIGFGFAIFGIMLFGWPVFLIVWVCIAIYECWQWVDAQLHLRFWFDFYIRKKYDKLPEDKLVTFNQSALRRDNKSIRNRLYKLGVRKLNQRNNYTYKEPEPNF